MVKFADKLLGQKIAVVGGTSGIGLGAAKIFLEAGAKVIIISSSQEKVDKAVRELESPHVEGRSGNVRDEASFIELLKSIAPLDHLVFSAVDNIIRGPLAEADLEDAKYLFGVKFWGSVVVGKALAKHDIVKSGGSLTLTSGGAALRPQKGATIGAALNSGVISLTPALADELTAKRIRVNTVVPGYVKTELWDKMGKTKEEQEQMAESNASKVSVGFTADGDDIAEAYLYAVRANYANGSIIVINGGAHL